MSRIWERERPLTYDTIFWVVIGAGFVLTGLVGILLMWKTGLLLLSFLAGSAVNIAITASAVWWWASVFPGTEQHFARMFGIFGLGVSFVNNEVLLFFAQLAMKKKIGGDPPREEYVDFDDED
ncbi:hypothetical protein P9314_10555 [Paenibacillus validus]|uniref:hypothetical protein n=1 Tax=Paenibacillus TaxID=44249 RepID=UPI001E2B45C7|nr:MULTISPECIES: hypothetical protein [Paenibacillus]MED4601143.1 hypothetical protein [Paenibacillus validus]MED4609575.1 hypothetical protein [Paenibacillus validus]